MPIDLSKVISAGVGPIIVISGCGLLCSTFYNRLSNVITRLRGFQRERLAEQLLLDRESDPASRARRVELLAHLSVQTERLFRRARHLRKALFCLLSTIAALLLCSLTLGLSAFFPPLIGVAVVFFVIGLSIMLAGIGFAMVDLKLSLDPVILESDFVARRLRGIDEG